MNLLERLAGRPPDPATPAGQPADGASGPVALPGVGGRRRPEGPACELCAQTLPGEHEHLVDVEDRRLLCTCQGCRLLLDNPGAGGGRYRRVPRRYRQVDGALVDGPAWAALDVPVGLSFLLEDSAAGRVVAFYPSPGGATESELDVAAWEKVVAADPVLATVEADVEAVLVSSPDRRAPVVAAGASAEAFVVPVDACYALVGTLRSRWRGFDGGREVHDAVDAFLADLRARAGGRS